MVDGRRRHLGYYQTSAEAAEAYARAAKDPRKRAIVPGRAGPVEVSGVFWAAALESQAKGVWPELEGLEGRELLEAWPPFVAARDIADNGPGFELYEVTVMWELARVVRPWDDTAEFTARNWRALCWRLHESGVLHKVTDGVLRAYARTYSGPGAKASQVPTVDEAIQALEEMLEFV